MCSGLWPRIAVGALGVIFVYVAASTTYSFWLKKKPIVDVFMLAGLYTIRVLGGGIATGHPASVWLLAFSGFLFLSLALVKRSEEMLAVARSDGERSGSRRGYWPEDVPILQMFGCGSTFASSVVLALFVGSTAASAELSLAGDSLGHRAFDPVLAMPAVAFDGAGLDA